MKLRSWIIVVLIYASICPASALTFTPEWTYDANAHGIVADGNFRGHWSAVDVSDSAVLLLGPEDRQFVAVDKATGKQLWSADNPKSNMYYPFAGWLRLVDSDDALVAVYNSSRNTVEVRSVRKGNVIDPLGKSGRSLLRKAGAEKEPLLAAAGPGSVLIANILTGSTRHVAMPKDYRIEGQTYVVYLDDNRLCVRIDTDNGYAGHSGWAKYLYCCDLASKKLWQFPKTFHLHNGNCDVIENSVDTAYYVKSAGVVVTVIGSSAYGLRSRDGKILWRSAAFGLKSPAAFGQGIVGLSSDDGGSTTTSLVYFDAKTGAHKVLGSVPKTDTLQVVGNYVFLAGGRQISMLGRIRIR